MSKIFWLSDCTVSKQWSQLLQISDVNVSFFLWSKAIRFSISIMKKRMFRSFFLQSRKKHWTLLYCSSFAHIQAWIKRNVSFRYQNET
jgi:hypothetical protein